MSEKFWMYDITELFRSFQLIPSSSDSLAVRYNALTRLAFIVCAVLALVAPTLALVTLLLMLAFFIAMYSYSSGPAYIVGQALSRRPVIEKYVELPSVQTGLDNAVNASNEMRQLQLSEFMKEYTSVADGVWFTNTFPPTQKRFCNDAVLLTDGCDYVSMNQSLAGQENAKVKIPPIVVAPSHDFESWKNNDFVVPSGINRRTNYDPYRAGYLSAQCCPVETVKPVETESPVSPSEPTTTLAQKPTFGRTSSNQRQIKENYNKENYPNVGQVRSRPLPARLRSETTATEDESYDIPVTVIPTPMFESRGKDNLLTQTLQPGVYQKTNIGEPIQSNIGISYTPQFVPTEIEETERGIKFTQRNPCDILHLAAEQEIPIEESVDNVYDPRFTGYGTGYRAYVDSLTGQPRFFYDDIDSITMPNYITRSHVDVFPWADTYGPDTMKSTDNGNEYRRLANNAFTDSTILFRTEMQERLMRKRNAELWQQRLAPISTLQRL